ncbi:unnamed protein product [Microthlaspi erraticum]|uniref:Uncharacterized protein n=1 Tax=Microthlaspi erraticum TaxID=1685480 RepID=A0A6D2JU55_9BRAS|nr:unnamed protein product [Microthlaspi erraticum]
MTLIQCSSAHALPPLPLRQQILTDDAFSIYRKIHNSLYNQSQPNSNDKFFESQIEFDVDIRVAVVKRSGGSDLIVSETMMVKKMMMKTRRIGRIEAKRDGYLSLIVFAD